MRLRDGGAPQQLAQWMVSFLFSYHATPAFVLPYGSFVKERLSEYATPRSDSGKISSREKISCRLCVLQNISRSHVERWSLSNIDSDSASYNIWQIHLTCFHVHLYYLVVIVSDEKQYRRCRVCCKQVKVPRQIGG